MEMENSRRSAIDRPRELGGLKRPRLAPPEDSPPADRTPASSSAAAVGGRDRQFLPPRAGAQQPTAPPRPPRTAEREEAPRVAGGSYQELLAQYKAALAELTFNSKPIITNLTIIAGENFHAAKGIASVICANVLEVPSEQKLPSLYLLDSIVKNIGRDYIKQFSARLPEVFCKAYKQVDPSIHSSMRHLFGTWKGVFPSAPLQLIEKELGFTSVVNGSSGSTSSKLDSQAQGPPRSIHVNPKYLEARQRLQQTTRAKELSDHDTSSVISSFSDIERSNGTALAGRARQWENTSTKMPNMQRPQRVNDPIQDKRGFRNAQGLEFSSDISQELDTGDRRVNDRIKEQEEHNRAYYGVNMGSSPLLCSKRKTFDVNNSYEAYQESASARANNQLATNMISVDRNSIGTSKSWKNSEEEEYVWDDVNSKASDFGGSGSFMTSGWKNDDNDADKAIISQDRWHTTETEHLQNKSLDALIRSAKASKGERTILAYKDLEDYSIQAHSKHENDPRRSIEASPDSLYAQRTTSEYQTNPTRVPHKSSSPAIGLGHKMSNCNQSEEYSFSYGGAFGQRLDPASPSDVSSSAYVNAQHNKLPNVPSYSQHRVNQNDAQPLHMISESIASPLEPFQKPETISISGTQSHHPLLQQSQPSESLTQPRQNSRLLPSSQGSGMQQIGKLSATNNSDNLSIETSGHPDASKLLAAIMKSGILPSTSVGNSQDLKMQPPLPKGPPPIKSFTSSAPSIPSSSLSSLPASSSNATATKQLPERDVLPPLPPGPPPLLGANLDSSKQLGFNVNPISSLLSSLVAKGLLSSPSTEFPTASVAQVSDNLKNERNYIASKTLDQAISTLPIKNIVPSLPNECSAPKTVAPLNDVLSHSIVLELRDLIGIEFKSEIIRESHPSVIDSLFDDLKHQCNICGLRYRYKDDIHNHFDWHASKESEMSNSRRSRRWYADLRSWVNGTATAQPGMAETDILLDEIVRSDENFEPMVPADESQSICMLCGEPFEDFYSEERDEWMYRGTTYLDLSNKQGDVGFLDKTSTQLPIVHAQCIA